MGNSRPTNISDLARESLEIPEDVEITEQILQKHCDLIIKRSSDTNLKIKDINITKEDERILDQYMDSRQCSIKIDGKRVIFDKDTLDYLNAMEKKEIPIRLNLIKLNKFQNHPAVKKNKIILEITQDEIDGISDEELSKLLQNKRIQEIEFNFDRINLLDIEKLEKLPNLKIKYKDTFYNEKDLSTVKMAKQKIEMITKDIKESDSDITKFAKIYKKLSHALTYDYTVAEVINNEKKIYASSQKGEVKYNRKQEEQEKIAQSQNLTGLITGITVCAGYSRILQATLESVGIDCKYIIGSTNSEKNQDHAWNQVKIDGNWYNTDLTWDKNSLEFQKIVEEGIISHYPRTIEYLEYCLKSDKDFKNHNPQSSENETCTESYDTDKLMEAFSFRKNEPNEILDILQYNKLVVYRENLFTKLSKLWAKAKDKIFPSKEENTQTLSEIKSREKDEIEPWNLKNWEGKEKQNYPIIESKNTEKKEIEEER